MGFYDDLTADLEATTEKARHTQRPPTARELALGDDEDTIRVDDINAFLAERQTVLELHLVRVCQALDAAGIPVTPKPKAWHEWRAEHQGD